MAQLANQQAALETAKVRLSYTRIRAAWETGGDVRFVGERFVNAGAMLSSNTPILSVIELQPITAVIHVTEKDYFRLKPEQPVVLTSGAFPGRSFAGRVARVAPLLKETSREARVEVDVENPDGSLKPGMFVNARIEFVNRADATIVPTSALVTRGAVRGCSWPTSRTRRPCSSPSTVGIIEGDRAEIVEPARLVGPCRHPRPPPPRERDAHHPARGRARGRCPAPQEGPRRQAMKLSEFSIRRPIFTWMVTLVVIIIGLVSLSRLPVDLMPEVVYPTLNVNASYPNTGPEEIEEIITRPIEEALSAVPGVEEVFSTSSEGSSSVRIMFAWGTDLDAAADDVRERLDRIVGRLPEEVDRPTLRKFDPAQQPILQFGALSNLDPVQARRIIDEQIAYRLERVAGVASVDVYGGRQREIQVNLDPLKLKALGLPLNVITSKIRQENVDMPAGVIERGNYQILLRIPGVFTNLDQLRDTVVAVRDGVPIQLREIASVDDTFQRVTRVARINDREGMRLAVYKQSGENTVNVAERVLKEIAEIQRDIPQIELLPTSNSAEYIRRAINNVGSSAVWGAVLAILALLVFLVNIRSTLVVAISIPISLIGTHRPDLLRRLHPEHDDPRRPGPRHRPAHRQLHRRPGEHLPHGGGRRPAPQGVDRWHERGRRAHRRRGHHDLRRLPADDLHAGHVGGHVQAAGLRRQLRQPDGAVRRPDHGPHALEPAHPRRQAVRSRDQEAAGAAGQRLPRRRSASSRTGTSGCSTRPWTTASSSWASSGPCSSAACSSSASSGPNSCPRPTRTKSGSRSRWRSARGSRS